MKFKSALITILAALSLGLACAPAFSQTPMDDPLDDRSARRLDRMEKVMRELRAIVFQARSTGKPVVVQPAETDAQIQTLTERVTDLEQSLARMTGQNETLSHDLDQSRRALGDSKASNAALQQRVEAIEKRLADMDSQMRGPASPPPATVDAPDAAPPSPPPAVETEAQSFASAKRMLVNGDNRGAESAFGDFVDKYGDGPRGPEARYWLGETLFARKAYSDAGAAYLGALRGWPVTGWAPTATVQLARSLVAIGNKAQACRALDELTRHYPKAQPPVPARAATTRVQAACPAAAN
jgi:tol-pal system protein YbgF